MFANDFVNNDCVNGFLFPGLLAFEFVVGHDTWVRGESRVVCEHRGYNTMGGTLRYVVVSVTLLVTRRRLSLLRTRARCPWHPCQLVAFTVAAIFACFNRLTVEFVG
jgi:hypothetical protein